MALEIYGKNLYINGVEFNELPVAESLLKRQELLARSKTSVKMHGYKKYGSFPLLLSGKLIPMSVLLNEQTKFSKLQVGKNIVTAKQR